MFVCNIKLKSLFTIWYDLPTAKLQSLPRQTGMTGIQYLYNDDSKQA